MCLQIRRKLNGYSIRWRASRKKSLLTTKNETACLNFAREQLNRPDAFLKSILWTYDNDRIVCSQSKVPCLDKCQHFLRSNDPHSNSEA